MILAEVTFPDRSGRSFSVNVGFGGNAWDMLLRIVDNIAANYHRHVGLLN